MAKLIEYETAAGAKRPVPAPVPKSSGRGDLASTAETTETSKGRPGEPPAATMTPTEDQPGRPSRPPPPPLTGTEEWAPLEPTQKDMGLARLTLDRGVKTTVIGQLYGLDYEVEGDGFSMRVFFDNYNRRLKVLDYDATDYRALCDRLVWLADANEYDKIFLKATEQDWQRFLGLGFMLEGILKYYFKGENAFVLSRFGSIDRLTSEHLIEESSLIEKLLRSDNGHEARPVPEGYRFELAGEDHIPGLVMLYRQVFKTYPSPLTHPDYIQQTMKRNVLYRAALNDAGEVVSAASAEIGEKHSNAELTDCATRNDQRGKGLMFHLLAALEGDLRDRRIMTGYTLARAQSVGMNRVFFHLDYEYSGRLLNNCDIYGQFEDMNIWVKRLLPSRS